MSETFSPPNMSSLVQGEEAKAYKERVGYFRIFDTLATIENMIAAARTSNAREALITAQKKLLDLGQTEEFIILPASKWNARKLKELIDQAWYKSKVESGFNLKSDAPQDPADPATDPSAQNQGPSQTQPPVEDEAEQRKTSPASSVTVEDDADDKRQYKPLTADEFEKMLSKLSLSRSLTGISPGRGSETSFVLNFRDGEKKDHYDIHYRVDERGKPTISTKAGMTYDQAFNLIELSVATMGSSLRMTNPNMTVEDKDKLYVAAMTHGSRETMMDVIRQIRDIKAGKRKEPISISGKLEDFITGKSTPEGILLQDCLEKAPNNELYVPSKDMLAEIAKEHERARHELNYMIQKNPQYFSQDVAKPQAPQQEPQAQAEPEVFLNEAQTSRRTSGRIKQKRHSDLKVEAAGSPPPLQYTTKELRRLNTLKNLQCRRKVHQIKRFEKN